MDDMITIITKERKKMQISPSQMSDDGESHIAVCNLLTGEIIFSLQPGDVLEHHKPRFFPEKGEYFYPSPARPFVILYNEGLEELIRMRLSASEQAVFFGLCAYIP